MCDTLAPPPCAPAPCALPRHARCRAMCGLSPMVALCGILTTRRWCTLAARMELERRVEGWKLARQGSPSEARNFIRENRAMARTLSGDSLIALRRSRAVELDGRMLQAQRRVESLEAERMLVRDAMQQAILAQQSRSLDGLSHSPSSRPVTPAAPLPTARAYRGRPRPHAPSHSLVWALTLACMRPHTHPHPSTWHTHTAARSAARPPPRASNPDPVSHRLTWLVGVRVWRVQSRASTCLPASGR